MRNILNITNGDCAVEIMKKADIPGVFLPWQDVLHDGPVPKGLSLEKLSKVRAKFIISRGWGTPEDVERIFVERDNTLRSFEEYEKVILWFEHDLYDQLQILQILDWFHENYNNEIDLSIICVDKYLGMLSPEEMKGLFKYEEPVTDIHLLLSSKAWSAFRSNSPEEWHNLLNIDTSVLPFLEGAIVRLLEEFPNSSNGLSRTAQQALAVISEGEKLAGKIFGRSQEKEHRMFLGDSSFWVILQELLDSKPALLELSQGKVLTLPATKNQELTITPVGLEVLEGKNNWLEMVDLDRWIGGVHLNSDNLWLWNSKSGSVVKNN
jgi:hypothetical protein